MTTEEAIEILSDVGDINRCCAEDAEALDMAIKALEQDPCEDCISRQRVLDMATTIQTDDFSGNEIIEAVDVDDIKAMPSVTPQPKIGHWINLEKTKYKGQVLPFWGRYECSECGGHGQDDFNFCPNCGARMAESEGEE